jgi:hypothetical protein
VRAASARPRSRRGQLAYVRTCEATVGVELGNAAPALDYVIDAARRESALSAEPQRGLRRAGEGGTHAV